MPPTSTELRTASYAVLSLVARMQPATAYQLKQLASEATTNFWALPHTLIYTETQRLQSAGFLDVDEERDGRRRRRYSLTDLGQQHLDDWLNAPTVERRQTHDPGLLKIFAGADPRLVAADQIRVHEAQLRVYELIDTKFEPADDEDPENEDPDEDSSAEDDDFTDLDTALRSTLAAGIGIERQYISFWKEVLHRGRATPPPTTRRPIEPV